MIEDEIAIHTISGIIDAGERIIGHEAIKAANEVEGQKLPALPFHSLRTWMPIK